MTDDDIAVSEVYRLWWTHDAQWYQGVARRFGAEAANELNAAAVRVVAEKVAKYVGKVQGKPLSAKDFAQAADACLARMSPASLRDGEVEAVDDSTVQVVLRRNFSVVMVRMAGSAETYRCPCRDIHQGWADGLGVGLRENEIDECSLRGDSLCRMHMTME